MNTCTPHRHADLRRNEMWRPLAHLLTAIAVLTLFLTTVCTWMSTVSGIMTMVTDPTELPGSPPSVIETVEQPSGASTSDSGKRCAMPFAASQSLAHGYRGVMNDATDSAGQRSGGEVFPE